MAFRSNSRSPQPAANGPTAFAAQAALAAEKEYKELSNSDLSDKIIIFAGAGTDPIASATAIRLSTRGAQLVLVDAPKNQGRLTTLASSCDAAALHGNKWQFRANKWQRVQKAFVYPLEENPSGSAVSTLMTTVVDTFGKIDGLIFKSANVVGSPFGGQNSCITSPGFLALLDASLNNELLLLVHLVQAAVPYLEQTSGTIINLSTTVVIKPDPCQVAAAVSRSAIDMFIKCLALELGPKKVRFNSINHLVIPSNNPALVQGLEVNQSMVDQYMAKMEKEHLGQRPLRAEDVASSVLYLLTPRSSFLNGINLVIDGGKTL